MKKLLIGLAMLLGAEGAAKACSCVPNSHDPVAMRQAVDQFVRRAVALVEAEIVSGFDRETRLGEVMRVHRTLAGEAPTLFRIARAGRFPDSASCDSHYRVGERHYVVIFPPARPATGDTPEFADQSYCGSFLLGSARFREMLIEAMRRPRSASHSSDSSAGVPCASNV